MILRTSEWIALAYFSYLGGAALGFRLDGARRIRAAGGAAVVIASILGVASAGQSASAERLRDWLPLAYILAGYWLPALLVTRHNHAFERALLALDCRWFGVDEPTTFAARAPRAAIELLEFAYLFCYPMIPAGFLCLYIAGFDREADRFWTAVLLAVFSCYGVLPWLPTRPPRMIEQHSPNPRSPTKALNLQILNHASIQLNTFPSGHAAAAVATALAVGARLPSAGVAFGLLALGISVGSVVGRYHYAADTLSGALVGILAFLISRVT